MATLYQEHSKEGNAKTEELASAVKELQGLLAEADKKYNKVEAESKEAKIKQEEVLAKKEETIGALKKELEAGNKLIKTMREKGLSEASIECLSPSAAQASKLLKSGVTVTGIYSQMVGLGEELQAEKAETQRLNLYIEQILHEIEERAPLLKQQREDYEKAVAAVGGLTESLESAREEVELRRSEAEEARRRLAGVERDRDRQAQQASDLGRQVTTLVREVEASRGGARTSLMDTSSQPLDTSNVNSLIEGRLLTFRDVAELQERNIELVAVVRELSAQHEAQESSLVEEKTAELRQELDTAMRQVRLFSHFTRYICNLHTFNMFISGGRAESSQSSSRGDGGEHHPAEGHVQEHGQRPWRHHHLPRSCKDWGRCQRGQADQGA